MSSPVNCAPFLLQHDNGTSVLDYFNYLDGRLCAEQVDLHAVAEEYGTPAYVYSRATLERHYQAFDTAFGDQPHLICYAVKANSNLAVLNVLAQQGSGFDIVSGGELRRVLAAGGDATKCVFSGVGKAPWEIELALDVGIHCFNVESEAELERISHIAAARGDVANISLRVNPDVDAETHPYISTGLKENKFGIDIELAEQVYQRAAKLPGLKIVGVDCHIGSQLTSTQPFVDALHRVLALVDTLAENGITLSHIDIGGGLGVRYNDETPPEPAEYMTAVLPLFADRDVTVLLEPGRAIAANAGVMLTTVEHLKTNGDQEYAIVDGAMNDLLRPALYSAWQEIVPVIPRDGATTNMDVVGPVCETGDFLGKQRELRVEPGDVLAIRSAGAYGFVMSSNYNSRPRAVELMVDGDKVHVVRKRETIESLFAGEAVLPD